MVTRQTFGIWLMFRVHYNHTLYEDAKHSSVIVHVSAYAASYRSIGAPYASKRLL